MAAKRRVLFSSLLFVVIVLTTDVKCGKIINNDRRENNDLLGDVKNIGSKFAGNDHGLSDKIRDDRRNQVPFADTEMKQAEAVKKANDDFARQELLKKAARQAVMPKVNMVPAKQVGVFNAVKSIRIAEHKSCAEDVKKYCKGSSVSNNFGVLECLQNDVEDGQEVSQECQHYIWVYKRNLTVDTRFENAAKDVCATDLDHLKDCANLPLGQGQFIPCLIDSKDNVTNRNCKEYLNKMAILTFSDYRLISMFTDSCQSDITRLTCGRLEGDEEGSPHSQGRTIECLEKNIQELGKECKKQIMRIAELQADDYHLDRPLYYACRHDRERFCDHVKAGNGKIYKCLFKHKFEPDMSSECRSKIVRRQRFIKEDVKANKGLFDACRVDIHKHKCLRHKNLPEGRSYRLSVVLLCLEGALKDAGSPSAVAPNCIAELKDARRSLMSDYQINPEIVSHCAHEIDKECKGLEQGGKTMHCLMAIARPNFREHDKPGQKVSSQCLRALEDVLREADVGENVMMDPFLADACQEVMDIACKQHKPGDSGMMNCLMEKMGTDQMQDECEDRLTEIQYFMARDFRLSDSKLYKYCHRDANRLCNAPKNWWDPDSNAPELGTTVFMCLYRHLTKEDDDGNPDEPLSRPCSFEVLRVMRQRAVNIDLEPRVEQPCLTDLGYYCSENVEKGQEMQCLQKNYDQLSDECREAVEKFTEDEDHYVDLDKMLMKACTPMIKTFCMSLIEDDQSPPEDVMECLIKHKTDPKMDAKCAVGIEHHQLTSQKDFRFSYKFKEACKKDVTEVCKDKTIKQKFHVVECLSQAVRNDTLMDKPHRVSIQCRKQLRFELLQRSENVELDPLLRESCAQNIKQYCPNITPGRAAVLECLKIHQKKLDEKCLAVIFKREEAEASDSRVDFALVTTCKAMIKTYCSQSGPGELFPCLRRHKDEEDFTRDCKRMVLERLRIKALDINLNPRLRKSCTDDIKKFCKVEMETSKHDHKLMEGRVMVCLRKFFSLKRLSETCESHMSVIVKESARDYKQDPRLAKACNSEIHSFCDQYLDSASNKDADEGQVEECLLNEMTKGKITNQECILEVARVARESKADVHVDPLLYRACALDIKTSCGDIPRGMGRQMSCLLSALGDSSVKLTPDCKKMLKSRVQLWEYAAKAAPPETAGELLSEITSSPSRNYFMGVFVAMVGILFIMGLFCGRITKRVSAQVKNK